MSELTQKIKSIVGGDVNDTPDILEKFSTDYSLFKVDPSIVVSPINVSDISALVKLASESDEKKLSLTARGAGTDMTGGPLNDSVILDFTKYFNKIIEVGEGYATAQPGVYYRDFEKATLAKGFFMPSYPASKNLCTIGGIVANNSGGEKTLRWGKTEDYVTKVRLVLHNGDEHEFKPMTISELEKLPPTENLYTKINHEMYKLIDDNYELIMKAKPQVSKNSAGYYLWNVLDREHGTFDLTKLIVGSQGTLGIITEASFKLIKPKEHSGLLIIFVNDFHRLGDLINTVLKHDPESFEAYDDNTFNIALKFLPNLIKTMGASNVISLGWRFLPEFWMAVTGGVPKLVLVAEFTGDSEEEIFDLARKAERDINKNFDVKTHVAKDDSEEDKYWTVRRESFKLLTDHSKGKRTAPFIDDVVVSPDKLPEFLPKLNEIMSHYDLTFTIQGHIGDGNFHIIPLVDIGDTKIKQIVPELSKKVFDLVLEYGGSITGEHNDGLVRSPYLKQMYGQEIYNLFEKVKKIFDPNNIFNPRKKIGSTIEYATEHMKV